MRLEAEEQDHNLKTATAKVLYESGDQQAGEWNSPFSHEQYMSQTQLWYNV